VWEKFPESRFSNILSVQWQVRTKEDRKKSPVQEEARILLGRERSKSDGRGGGGGGGSAAVEGSRTKLVSGHQGDETKPLAAGGKSATFRTGKFSS
jgi:hypothetical protein